MPLIDPNLKPQPHSIDQEPSVSPEPRHPADVIDQMLKVVPEEYKHRLRFLFKSISRYMAPELLQGSFAWDQIQSVVMQMVPPPPQKLTEEWQLKVVAILMNKSEDVIKKHFGKE